MKNLYIILTSLFITSLSAQETTTIYLIRHAEKADTSPDTELSEAGKARAREWMAYFSDKNIAALYSTSYRRTNATIEPLAKAYALNVNTYGPPKLDLKAIAAKYTGKGVLIVGHSNTIPNYVNELIGENTYDDIDEEQFGYVFTITINGQNVTHKLEKL